MTSIFISNLPDPRTFSDWQAWARALVAELGRGTEGQPPQAPVTLASLLPDAVDQGVLFYVANATGAVKLAMSMGTGYVNVNDGSAVA